MADQGEGSPGDSGRILCFEDWCLDLENRLLLRQGREIPLTPKVFDTLAVLAQNSGHLLSKQDLMTEIWPDSYVEEANLTQNISVLRRTLQDDAAAPRFIETVPKHGYRFIPPVHAPQFRANGLPGGAEEAVPGRNEVSEAASRIVLKKSMGRFSVILSALLVLSFLSAILYYSTTTADHPKPTSVSPSPRTVAVLPFRNLHQPMALIFWVIHWRMPSSTGWPTWEAWWFGLRHRWKSTRGWWSTRWRWAEI